MRVVGWARVGVSAIPPNNPTEATLGGREPYSYHDDREDELGIVAGAMLRKGRGNPPPAADEHPDGSDRDYPDCNSQKASHQLSPLDCPTNFSLSPSLVAEKCDKLKFAGHSPV